MLNGKRSSREQLRHAGRYSLNIQNPHEMKTTFLNITRLLLARRISVSFRQNSEHSFKRLSPRDTNFRRTLTIKNGESVHAYRTLSKKGKLRGFQP